MASFSEKQLKNLVRTIAVEKQAAPIRERCPSESKKWEAAVLLASHFLWVGAVFWFDTMWKSGYNVLIMNQLN